MRPCLPTLNVLSEHVVCVRYWAKFTLLNKHSLNPRNYISHCCTTTKHIFLHACSFFNTGHNRESEDLWMFLNQWSYVLKFVYFKKSILTEQEGFPLSPWVEICVNRHLTHTAFLSLLLTVRQIVKGIVRPKMTILLSFTQPQVVPNLLSSVSGSHWGQTSVRLPTILKICST